MSDTILAALIGGSTGAVIAGLMAFINSLFQRRHDRAMRILDHTAKLGLEDWSRANENAWQLKEAGHGPVQVMPLDMYVIQAYGLAELLAGRKVNLGPIYAQWHEYKQATHQAAAKERSDYRERLAEEKARRQTDRQSRG